jgi:hypothetical protein
MVFRFFFFGVAMELIGYMNGIALKMLSTANLLHPRSFRNIILKKTKHFCIDSRKRFAILALFKRRTDVGWLLEVM